MKNILLSIFALTMVSGISCDQLAERVFGPHEGVQKILDQELQKDREYFPTIKDLQKAADELCSQVCAGKILKSGVECNKAKEAVQLLQQASMAHLPNNLSGHKAGILAECHYTRHKRNHYIYVLQNGTYIAKLPDTSTPENK